MKLSKIAIPVLLLALVATTAQSQTFKSDYATQLILAGGGTDPVHTLTLGATAGAAPITLLFPNAATAATYVLSSDGLGHLTWSSSGGGITLSGDVRGTAGSDTINNTIQAGNDIIAALNTAVTANSLNAGALKYDSTLLVNGANNELGLNLSQSNNWTGLQNFSDGLNTSGGTANINATGNNPVNIGITNNGATGLMTIGDSTSPTNVSITDVNGEVNFGGTVDFDGPVNIPAGDLNLGLANDKFYIGNSSGVATPQTITQDVSINDTGLATVNGSHAPTFVVTGNESIADTFTVSGPSTINNNLHVSGNVSSSSVLTGSEDILGTLLVGGASTLHGVTDTGIIVNVGNLANSGNLNNGGSVELDTTTALGGTNLIGNTASTTNFLGTVNFPAGTVTASSLHLGNDSVLIGGSDNDAHERFITQDVSINDTGLATVNGSHAPTFVVTGNESIADTFTVSGPSTINNNLHVSGNVSSSSVLTGSEDILGTLLVGGASTLHGVTDTGIIVNVGNLANSGNLNNGGSVDLDTTTGAGGTNTIGNTTSTTNFLGSVNFPAGSVTASSLGLGNDSVLIGGTDSHAHAQPITQDVSITNGGVATVLSAHGNFSIGDTLTANGPTTINGPTDINNSLRVAGPDTINNTLTLAGPATFNNTLNVAGPVRLGTTLTVIDPLIDSEGLTSSGGPFTVNSTGNAPISLGAGGTYTGIITIGDSAVGNVSTTDIDGNVNFTGPVNFPAGSVTASSLGLGNDSVLIGGVDNHAHAQAISQDVTVTSAGVATVDSSHATTFAVVHAETVGSTLNVTGQTTLGSTGLSAATTVVAADPLVLNASHSYFPLSSSSAVTVNTISGANTTAGQIIVLVNTNAAPTTATNYITLHSNGTLVLNGSDVIIGAGGSATLISDGTNWHLMSAE